MDAVLDRASAAVAVSPTVSSRLRLAPDWNRVVAPDWNRVVDSGLLSVREWQVHVLASVSPSKTSGENFEIATVKLSDLLPEATVPPLLSTFPPTG